MTLLLTKTTVDYVYQVFHDDDGFHDAFESNSAIEFASEADRTAHMNKHLGEDLFFFRVDKLTICKCCNHASKTEDSLSGIESECAIDALAYFIDHVERE